MTFPLSADRGSPSFQAAEAEPPERTVKNDKEHDSLEKYPEMRERMYKLLNEGRQHNRQQSKVKRKEEEI